MWLFYLQEALLSGQGIAKCTEKHIHHLISKAWVLIVGFDSGSPSIGGSLVVSQSPCPCHLLVMADASKCGMRGGILLVFVRWLSFHSCGFYTKMRSPGWFLSFQPLITCSCLKKMETVTVLFLF